MLLHGVRENSDQSDYHHSPEHLRRLYRTTSFNNPIDPDYLSSGDNNSKTL